MKIAIISAALKTGLTIFGISGDFDGVVLADFITFIRQLGRCLLIDPW